MSVWTTAKMKKILGAKPVYRKVEGAPYQPGQKVRVVTSAEEAGSGLDVFDYVGAEGRVRYLEYSCGCGQTYPGDPMVGVAFPDGRKQEFWCEELALLPEEEREHAERA